MFADHYHVLGLAPGAAPEAIRRRYRRLAARCHPDLYAGDPTRRDASEQRMKAINAAYHVLKDASRRAAYDAERARRARRARPSGLVRRPARHVQARPPVPVKTPRARPAGRFACWAAGLVITGLIAARLWPLMAAAPAAVEGRLLQAPPVERQRPAAALERFIAAYHAGDVAGAAEMLDPDSVRVIIAVQAGHDAVCREFLFDNVAAAQQLLAAGLEVRRAVALPGGASYRHLTGSGSNAADYALLACLGGLSGGVEFRLMWEPLGLISPGMASAHGRFYTLSPAREAIPGSAAFTLRRRADGWRIGGIVLRAPAR